LVGLCGYEADRGTPDSPSNIVVLAESPIDTGTEIGYNNMTVYQHPSGAIVFATGSMQESWGLDNFFGGEIHLGSDRGAKSSISANGTFASIRHVPSLRRINGQRFQPPNDMGDLAPLAVEIDRLHGNQIADDMVIPRLRSIGSLSIVAPTPSAPRTSWISWMRPQ